MDGMYEISEMARMFDVSRQTLIYYDRIGLFRPAAVGENGYRFYAPTQIPTLRLICMLRDVGVELKDIRRLLGTQDVEAIADRLRGRVGEIDAETAALARQRAAVAERLAFYDEVRSWRDREGVPTLRYYPERRVLFEPFCGNVPPARADLHVTLMRAIRRMREATGAGPVNGWGTMLRREAFLADDPLRGAGSFVTLPDATADDARSGFDDVPGLRVLPAGIYLCLSRWGMPYDVTGARALARALEKHGLSPVGDVFDFCLLDTTSYDELHTEDFCCLQVAIEL